MTSGENGATSIECELREVATTRTFLGAVEAVMDVHPRLRRITVRGESLASFAPIGPDTFVFLLVPPPGRRELCIDESFTWELHAELPDADRPVGAYYTVSASRPEAAELDLLVVLHGDDGPASAWATRAQPGDPLALWGPRTMYHPPADSDSVLLVADETGLPAVANILAELPAGIPALVVAEVGDEREQLALPVSPLIDVHWVHRDGTEPGATAALAEAVRRLPLPGARPYVWGAGESRAMTAVRNHVRRDVGLAREQVALVAYWRHATGPIH